MNKQFYKFFKPKKEIFQYYDNRRMVLDRDNDTKHRVFIDNGGKILLVAHLDTVLPPTIHKETSSKVVAQGLDDRLGCFLACQLIKSGVCADVLFTDHEETGKSTAQYHTLKNYNWICELDRGGVDYVTYGMSCTRMKTELNKLLKEGQGIFSDVCFMSTDIACFNLGIGYEYAHSKTSYFKKNVFQMQYDKFMKFYQDNADTVFRQDGTDTATKTVLSSSNYYSGFYESWCDCCGGDGGEYVHGWYVCQKCITDFMAGKQVKQGVKDVSDFVCDLCGKNGCASYIDHEDRFLCPDCQEHRMLNM
jgi:hypothetical protein